MCSSVKTRRSLRLRRLHEVVLREGAFSAQSRDAVTAQPQFGWFQRASVWTQQTARQCQERQAVAASVRRSELTQMRKRGKRPPSGKCGGGGQGGENARRLAYGREAREETFLSGLLGRLPSSPADERLALGRCRLRRGGVFEFGLTTWDIMGP